MKDQMKRQTKVKAEQFKLPFMPGTAKPQIKVVFDAAKSDAWVKELLARPASKLEGVAK